MTLIGVFGMLVFPTSGCNHQDPSPVRSFPMTSPQQVCFGRLRLRVPGPASVAFSHAEFEGAVLAWTALPSGQTFTSAWTSHLTELESTSILEQRFVPAPRRVGVLYRTKFRSDSELRNLEIWADYTPHILKSSGEVLTKETDTLQRYLLSALNNFRETTNEQPDSHDFCVDGGVITALSNYGESIRATIDIPAGNHSDLPERILLQVFTQVNSKSEPQTLPERVDRARDRLSRLGGTFRVLRRGERTVAGLKGYEYVVLETGGDKGRYGFNAQFEYGGLAAKTDAPQMTFSLDHDYPGTIPYQDLLAVWDGVLTNAKIETQ